MKFCSTKTHNGTRLSANIALDTDLLCNVKCVEPKSVITCTYNLENSCSDLPYNASEAFLVITLTYDNIYIKGVVYVDAADETESSPFLDDDTFECNVLLTPPECHQLEHALLRKLCFV